MPPEVPHEEPSKTCDTLMAKQELNAFKKSVEASYVGEDFVRMDHDIPVPPYNRLPKTSDETDLMTSEEYFRFLENVVRNPLDVARLNKAPYLTWEKDDAIKQRLFPAHVTLARGGGDCDNIAQVAKELLDAIDCRKGTAYKARVIMCPDVTHAVTIYTDEDGHLAAIEQGYLYENLTDIYGASSYFSNLSGTSAEFYEEIPLSLNSAARYSIDPKTMDRDQKLLYVNVSVRFKDLEDLKRYLPTDASTYEETVISFENNSKAHYTKGQLTQVTKGDEISHYQSERLVQKSIPGKVEFYDEQGNTIQVDYTDLANPIRAEVFDQNGRLKQRNFKNGLIELYDPETGILLPQ